MKSHESNTLAPSSVVDVSCLAKIFENCTNSYKFLFFKTLLLKLSANKFSKLEYNLNDIAIGMIENAWYPVKYFKLSLGEQDQISVIIKSFNSDDRKPPPASKIIFFLKQSNINLSNILRYPTQRILVPFFNAELKNVPDSAKDSLIKILSNQKFSERAPLYRISDNSIFIHSEWAKYFQSNLEIILGWIKVNWIEYLQSRNRSHPSVISKGDKPKNRTRLSAERKFWDQMIDNSNSLRCIFSGGELKLKGYALDHFIPWSFLCHDEPWNLAPVSPVANNSKSDFLPSLRYINDFSDLQYTSLIFAKTKFSDDFWKKRSSSYINDLGLSENLLLDKDELKNAYRKKFEPLIEIGSSIGFLREWEFSKN